MELSKEELKPFQDNADALTYDQAVTLVSGLRDARIIQVMLFLLSRVKRVEDAAIRPTVLPSGEPLVTIPAPKKAKAAK